MKRFLIVLSVLLFFVGVVYAKGVYYYGSKTVTGGGTTVYIGTTTCGAQSCTYASSDGTYINPSAGDTTYDTGTAVIIDGNAGIGLIYLDTSNLPADKTITSAKLWLYAASVDSTPDGSVTFHKMLTMPGDSTNTTWTENNVTYNERDASGNVQWGGDAQACPLSGTDYDAASLVTMAATDFTLSKFNEVSSATLTTLVHGWYSGGINNYGLIIFNSGDYSDVQVRSEDTPTAAQRLYWEITYTE